MVWAQPDSKLLCEENVSLQSSLHKNRFVIGFVHMIDAEATRDSRDPSSVIEYLLSRRKNRAHEISIAINIIIIYLIQITEQDQSRVLNGNYTITIAI